MAVEQPRIVIWCSDAPNQKALCVKLSQKFRIAGIVIEVKKTRHEKRNIITTVRLVWDRLYFAPIYNAWKKLQLFYSRDFVDWPSTSIVRVSGINDSAVKAFTEDLRPDLIVVSGTGLVKGELLKISANKGIVNLHTGLSPYVKGGPNCTNWCIANNDWHLVGNTIMWLNAGIDAGNIITSEQIDIKQAPDLLSAQKLVMEHAHGLYLAAVEYLLTTNPPYQSIGQITLGKGNLFLTKMWTSEKKRDLLRNWKRRNDVIVKPSPRCIKLPSLTN